MPSTPPGDEVRARDGASIETLIRSVLPLEDSALHWSPPVSGIGGPLPVLLELLYERLITRHDLHRKNLRQPAM